MDLNLQNVTEKFKLYSGEKLDGTETDRDELCNELCRDCAMLVRIWAKPELLEDEKADVGALEGLAAAEAFFQLATLDNAAAPQSVACAEIKIQLGDRAGYAQRLRDEKKAACAGMLAEDGFFFGIA